MNITNEQRDLVLKTASQHQKFLYTSPESGKKLRLIANQNGITDEDSYREFAVLVGDVILDLVLRAELPTKLSEALNISTEKAIKITADLIDYLELSPTSNDHPSQTVYHQDDSGESTYSTTQEAILQEGRVAPKDVTDSRWGNQT